MPWCLGGNAACDKKHDAAFTHEFFLGVNPEKIISLRPTVAKSEADRENVAQLLAKAFGGQENSEAEPLTSWTWGPAHMVLDPDTQKERQPKDWDDLENLKGICTGARKELFQFGMWMVLYREVMYHEHSFVIATRQKDGTPELHHGAIFGVVYPDGYRPPFSYDLQDIRVIWKYGFRRYSALESRHFQGEDLNRFRKRAALSEGPARKWASQRKQEGYIHISGVGIHPDHQGEGVCSLLMRAVNKYADEIGLPCYLECAGQKRIDVYSRFGYRVVDQEQLSIPEDAESGWPAVTGFCMKREVGVDGPERPTGDR